MNEESSPFNATNAPSENKPEVTAPVASSAQHGSGSAHEAPKSAEAPKQPAHEEPKRIMALLSYLGILFLVPLLMEKHRDDFVLFHLRQGIALFAIEVLASMLFWHRAAGDMLSMALLVVALVAAYRTYQGEKWQLPLIGHYAQRIRI